MLLGASIPSVSGQCDREAKLKSVANIIPVTVAFCAVAGIMVLFFAVRGDHVVAATAAIDVLALMCFATGVLPHMTTAFLSIIAFMILNLAPAEVVFSAFTTGGIWLTISGLIIGAAITDTGLGKQVAAYIFCLTGTSYARSIVLISVAGFLLGFLVPSTIPRVIIMMPVTASLAAAMGFERGSRGQIGLAAAAATSTLLPTYTVLTANLPTIVQAGALEALYGIAPSYANYLVAQLPSNIVRFAVILMVLLPFARNQRPEEPSPAAIAMGPVTAAQIRLLIVIGLAIALWATDSMHRVSPAWIAMGAAAIILWPPSGLLASDAMKSKIDMTPVFFLAGVFSVSAVSHHVGLDTRIAEALVPQLHLSEGSAFWDLYAITGLSTLLSHLVTAPAAPVVLAPLAGAMADASGLTIFSVGMAQINGVATPILPYQAPPLIVAMALTHIPIRILTRLCVTLAIATFVLGVPFTYLWWSLIGLI